MATSQSSVLWVFCPVQTSSLYYLMKFGYLIPPDE